MLFDELTRFNARRSPAAEAEGLEEQDDLDSEHWKGAASDKGGGEWGDCYWYVDGP